MFLFTFSLLYVPFIDVENIDRMSVTTRANADEIEQKCILRHFANNHDNYSCTSIHSNVNLVTVAIEETKKGIRAQYGRSDKRTLSHAHSIGRCLMNLLNYYAHNFISEHRTWRWRDVKRPGETGPREREREGTVERAVRRGEAVKPAETAINNFERECRSFNGINVTPRAAAATRARQHWPRVQRIVQRVDIIYVTSACYSTMHFS